MTYHADDLNRMSMNGYESDNWVRKASLPHTGFPRIKSTTLTDRTLDIVKDHMTLHRIVGEPCKEVFFCST